MSTCTPYSLLIAFSLVFTGCSFVPKAKVGTASVTGVKDQGTAATIDAGKATSGFDIPQGSKYVVTRVDPGLDMPQTVVEEWTFSAPSRFTSASETTRASTGTVDNTIAKHRITEQSRKWIMWVGIGFIGLGALLAFNPYMRYPLGGIGLAGTGGLLLFAHSHPTLFYIAIGVGALAAGIMFGGELMERIKKNGTPESS